MTEYLSEQKSGSQNLRGNGYLDVTFTVKNAGSITLLAHAPWWKEWDVESRSWLTNPTKRKMELFKPGDSSPVSIRVDEGWGETTSLNYDVPASEAGGVENWTARVTNREARAEVFSLTASYPGDIPIKSFEVPVNLVEEIVGDTFGQVKMRVTRGKNASKIDFPETLGVGALRFTVEDLVFDPWWWWLPAIREYPNDINSTDIVFSLENATSGFSNGFIRFEVHFEEHGKEILGSWHGQMSNMCLTIDLGLGVQNSKLTYFNTNADFSFGLDMQGIPDALLDPIIGYKGDIQQTVVSTVRAVFRNQTIRTSFSDAITQRVIQFLGTSPHIVAVKIQNNRLTVRYYNT